jgi:hypothetical protein
MVHPLFTLVSCTACCTGQPQCGLLPPPILVPPPPPPCFVNGCCTGCAPPPTPGGGSDRIPYLPPSGGGCFPCLGGDLDDLFKWLSSIDPNAKYGPLKNGAVYLNDIRDHAYTITFENLSTATAPAQTVIVTDTLDLSRFDLRTFRFGNITIGDSLFVTPEEKNYKQLQVTDMRPLVDLLVAIEASLDTLTGIIRWEFTSLDPATYAPPADPLAGFLPPNLLQNEGTGSVSFVCDYQSTVSTGDSVINRSSIVFDENAAIITGAYINVLDFNEPVSAVDALPATVSDTFQVTISGSDDLSGVAYYQVYVSTNDAPYEYYDAFHTGHFQFAGVNGNQYEFYAVATDRAGNVEQPPLDPETNPDAVTTIVTGIRKSLAKPDLVVFPNPVTHELQIEGTGKISGVSVVDLTGRKIMYSRIAQPATKISLDVSGMPAGVYWLEVVSGDHRAATRFVVMK